MKYASFKIWIADKYHYKEGSYLTDIRAQRFGNDQYLLG